MMHRPVNRWVGIVIPFFPAASHFVGLGGTQELDTMAVVKELANERDLTLFQLSQLCRVNYSTLKNAEARHSQLNVDTIEKICNGLHMPMSAFFAVSERRNMR